MKLPKCLAPARKLKICSCGLWVTTGNALKIIRDDSFGIPLLWFTCPDCKSTMTLVTRKEAV